MLHPRAPHMTARSSHDAVHARIVVRRDAWHRDARPECVATGVLRASERSSPATASCRHRAASLHRPPRDAQLASVLLFLTGTIRVVWPNQPATVDLLRRLIGIF